MEIEIIPRSPERTCSGEQNLLEAVLKCEQIEEIENPDEKTENQDHEGEQSSSLAIVEKIKTDADQNTDQNSEFQANISNLANQNISGDRVILGSLDCQSCGKHFRDFNELKSHTVTVHNEMVYVVANSFTATEAKETPEPRQRIESYHACNLCDKIFDTAETMARHWCPFHQCKYCNQGRIHRTFDNIHNTLYIERTIKCLKSMIKIKICVKTRTMSEYP